MSGDPCKNCPWTSSDPRDRDALTPEIRKAAEDGSWFCCHVNLGTCHGVARYAAARARVAQRSDPYAGTQEGK